MLHEIIAALQRRFSMCDEDTATLSPMLPQLEKNYFDSLVKINERFTIINRFMDAVETAGISAIEIEGKVSLAPSMYLLAFHEGLKDALAPYYRKLHKVELTILQDPFVSLPSIYNKISLMQSPLDALKETIEKVISGQAVGCQILEICYMYTHSGVQPLIDTFTRIQKPLIKVLLAQIKFWMLHGKALDLHDEFFIYECKTQPSDNKIEFTDEIFVGSRDKIRLRYLPKMVSITLAQKILFIGQTVKLFSQIPEHEDEEKHTDFSKYSGDKTKLINQFKKLENDFNTMHLEEIVNDAWLSTNHNLYQLAEEVGGLSTQLKLIKDIYLHGRGELFLEFLSSASRFLNADANTISCSVLNNALENAAYYVYLSDNSHLLNRIHFSLPKRGSYPTGTITLDVVELDYDPPWPLDIIFTNEVISKYSLIFNFLLKVKKAYQDICSSRLNLPKFRSENEKILVLHIRHQLVSLISNLQNYLYIDVIRSEFDYLESVVSSASKFSEVEKAHSIFLANVIVQTFLVPEELQLVKNKELIDKALSCHGSSVHLRLFVLLQYCETFANLIRDYDTLESPVHHFTNFQQKLNLLVKQLVGIIFRLTQSCGSNNMQSLILRLDYNRFFASTSTAVPQKSDTSRPDVVSSL